MSSDRSGSSRPFARLHVEEGRFTVRIDLRAAFDEEYEGDDDGFAWLQRWQAEARPRVARAVMDALREGGRFDVIPVSRGAAPDENLEIELRLRHPTPTTGRGAS